MSADAGLVVIGASHAGHQIAVAARQAGYAEPIILLSDEDALPYQRPPLSKAYMMGKVDADGLIFRSREFFQDQDIDLRLGVSVAGIDREAKEVRCADGSVLPYTLLAIATGTRVRPLPVPGAHLDGVHYIRTLSDIDRIMAELEAVQNVVVIGGGFIGLEGAAALRQMGKEVAVVELADRFMARGVGVTVSSFFANHHREQGVDVYLQTGVSELTGEGGKVAGVSLSNGEVLKADLVIAGIGVIANQELAVEAGLDCDDGILVDENARTSDPSIFGAGDVTRFNSRFAPMSLRLESVQNATDQARAAGAAIAGAAKPYDSAPWFWSDQFDLKLQMTGITSGHDKEVMRGEPSAEGFSVFYFKGDTWLGTDTVNRPSDHISSRRLLDMGYALSAEEAADETLALKDVLKQARKAS